MNDVMSALQSIISFCERIEIAGMSIIGWAVVVVIISGIGFILRGNK